MAEEPDAKKCLECIKETRLAVQEESEEVDEVPNKFYAS